MTIDTDLSRLMATARKQRLETEAQDLAVSISAVLMKAAGAENTNLCSFGMSVYTGLKQALLGAILAGWPDLPEEDIFSEWARTGLCVAQCAHNVRETLETLEQESTEQTG